MHFPFISLYFVALVLLSSIRKASCERSWASLALQVPKNLSDMSFDYPLVSTYFGKPGQPINLTINLNGDILGVYAEECVYCMGEDRYDPSESDTTKGPLKPWPGSDTAMAGQQWQETVDIGHVLEVSDVDFLFIQRRSYNAAGAPNGFFPLYVDPFTRSNSTVKDLLTKLWDDQKLLNPVVGLRIDPQNPRLTIGALDLNDYQGEINWVQMEAPSANGSITNAFKIDGVKGYNGTFLPMGDNITATLNSIYRFIDIPQQYTSMYWIEDGYLGPNQFVNLYPDGSGFALQCNWNSGKIPPTYFTVTINGVDYPLGDMLMNTTAMAAPGYCNFNLKNSSASDAQDVTLGAPFLRNVYVAYRFPTDSCPGYYGFAHLSKAPNPVASSIISQKPTSTPTQYSQCIANLIKPTSTPAPTAVAVTAKSVPTGQYWVFNRPSDGQVPLYGIEELPKGAWNSSN
ncbi:aspartic peptidase domain-containing protein [Flagelloscypha sp. PMI_526]|nr:aspartic peptidase domain-containing protein [Flagelloscypha sp. PMI_526]